MSINEATPTEDEYLEQKPKFQLLGRETFHPDFIMTSSGHWKQNYIHMKQIRTFQKYI
jgi:hypothetical protein